VLPNILGPLPVTQGNNKHILTFQDDLSKHVLDVPICQQHAETVARAFVANRVLKHGTHIILQTDKGANFISEVFRNTCRIIKIKKIKSAAFHPESQREYLEEPSCAG